MSVRGHAAEPEAIRAVAQAAEAAGFAMLGFTDHPAPSQKWLVSGGHPSYDPFAALGFVAAATTRIRLMTYLAVLPYRNPLLLAKNVATVDRLSGGRLTLVIGTGYLRSEFSALGRDFEARNELFDEAVQVLRRAFVDDDLRHDGHGFVARGAVQDPKPVQLPHPPIWIGGSSALARRRVVDYGSGWSPLLPTEDFARVVRTAPMAGVDDLRRRVADLRVALADAGRDPEGFPIQLKGPDLLELDPGDAAARVADLADAGVTHLVVETPAHDPLGKIAAFAKEFIS